MRIIIVFWLQIHTKAYVCPVGYPTEEEGAEAGSDSAGCPILDKWWKMLSWWWGGRHGSYRGYLSPQEHVAAMIFLMHLIIICSQWPHLVFGWAVLWLWKYVLSSSIFDRYSLENTCVSVCVAHRCFVDWLLLQNCVACSRVSYPSIDVPVLNWMEAGDVHKSTWQVNLCVLFSLQCCYIL